MHSITQYKNMKSNIFLQNAQYYKAREYEIKYLCTKCTVLQSTRIRNQIYLYKMNKCQFLQESFRNARNSWVILGVSIFFEQVSIPPGIHQESTRNARNSWVILGVSIFFEQVSIP